MLTKVVPIYEEWEKDLESVIKECNLTPLTTLEKVTLLMMYEKVINFLTPYEGKLNIAHEYQMRLGSFFDTGGSQIICEGATSDISINPTPTYNWHLQDTSRWLSACGIAFDKQTRNLSMHT